MKFGVIIFPGSNCDHDAFWTIQQVARQPVTFCGTNRVIWKSVTPSLSPGDSRLETICGLGPSPKFSPVMESVRRFADSGGLVLGICNGFQILCESGLLPGALMRNAGAENMFASRCRCGWKMLLLHLPTLVRKEKCYPSLSATWRATISAIRKHWMSCSATIASCFVIAPLPLKSQGRPIQTALWTISRHLQCGRQCGRHDASSRKICRTRTGLYRWHEDLPVHGGCDGEQVERPEAEFRSSVFSTRYSACKLSDFC